MAPPAPISGTLVIADISGYTGFLAGTELEHAQGVLADLTRLLLAHVRRPLELVKLEGDAVFMHLPDTAAPGPDLLVDVLEACYADFAGYLEDMARATTCSCDACRAIPTLDLKFAAHHGSYMLHDLAGTTDLVGPDVILVHRLLKNSVIEATGVRAYLLLTRACLDRLSPPPATVPHTETYEHFGEVACGVLDLRRALERRRAATEEIVSDRDADATYEHDLPAPPAVVWAHLVDPAQRARYEAGVTGITLDAGPRGRGEGAAYHCAHGSTVVLQRVIDWKPFRYFTVRGVRERGLSAPPSFRMTFELAPLAGGSTRVAVRMRLERRLLAGLVRLIARRGFVHHYRTSLERLAALLAEDPALGPGAPGDRGPRAGATS